MARGGTARQPARDAAALEFARARRQNAPALPRGFGSSGFGCGA
jgi:hypothetical protein